MVLVNEIELMTSRPLTHDPLAQDPIFEKTESKTV